MSCSGAVDGLNDSKAVVTFLSFTCLSSFLCNFENCEGFSFTDPFWMSFAQMCQQDVDSTCICCQACWHWASRERMLYSRSITGYMLSKYPFVEVHQAARPEWGCSDCLLRCYMSEAPDLLHPWSARSALANNALASPPLFAVFNSISFTTVSALSAHKLQTRSLPRLAVQWAVMNKFLQTPRIWRDPNVPRDTTHRSVPLQARIQLEWIGFPLLNSRDLTHQLRQPNQIQLTSHELMKI